jgi:hypothetical protein
MTTLADKKLRELARLIGNGEREVSHEDCIKIEKIEIWFEKNLPDFNVWQAIEHHIKIKGNS